MKNRVYRISLALLTLFLGVTAQAQVNENELQWAEGKASPYLEKVAEKSDWLTSRLQMYWHSHATDVFFNGETFDHAGGDRAPYATVKLNGTRSNASAYNRPRLEDIIPYDDDAESNVTFINKASGKMEKTHPSKTGCNIANVNREIASIAKAAATVYVGRGDERYAKMAADVVDVFLKGIAFRNVPTDLNHGHGQTLVGMTTFEVIHEDAIAELSATLRLLRPYLKQTNAPLDIYDKALKKWADNIIANGVPHNNWNLFQAEFVADVALALGDDSEYDDGKGRQYYLDYIINKNSIRQWSMKRLAEFGFDDHTGIWYESLGYSTTVVRDFTDFANRLDLNAGIDMFSALPVLEKAVTALPEYLFPNRMICGFGDTHPNYLSTNAMRSMADYARRHGRTSLENKMNQLAKAVEKDAPDSIIEPYVSPSFYAPNVSWLVQRTGMNPQHDLMYSLNGSLGNHQHANGISLELYGKGYVLGPDAGIGAQLYSGLDYSEYYSQFPAHNTVCVDGVSSYPVMMSQHAFKVEKISDGTGRAMFSQVAFLEPESQADQLRTVGIVKTSSQGGYYVDIFRSKKREGGDRTHDYFYHNLGQTMTLTAADGSPLNLQPTDELAFAGGHLYAYSYIYDKHSATTSNDVRAQFTTNCADGRQITMTMWMRGSDHRDVFRALSPVNMEYERMANQPYDIIKQPVLTFVARQHGEAWNHPFVAIFEPTDNHEPSEIASVSFFTPKSANASAVGIEVNLTDGSTDYIFSSPEKTKMSYRGITVNSIFEVVHVEKKR